MKPSYCTHSVTRPGCPVCLADAVREISRGCGGVAGMLLAAAVALIVIANREGG